MDPCSHFSQLNNKAIFRFANTVNSRSVDNIQRVVKTVKTETSPDLTCDQAMLMYGDDKLSRVKAVERILHIESSEQINDTLTNEELKTAGEMFLYLIMCPDTIKPWIVFYKDLFQTQSPNQIILSLNRVMKGPRTPTNEFFKSLAGTLFKRILNRLPGREAEITASIADSKAPQKFEGTLHHYTVAKQGLFLSVQSLHCLTKSLLEPASKS